MSRHRVYSPSKLASDAHVTLEGTQAHYLGRVLRAREGDEVVLFDGSGDEYIATIHRIDRKHVDLNTADRIASTTESPLSITLLQSVIRGERMDFCVQKATELGVRAIVPIFTTRSTVKIPQERIQKRTEHWHKIAVSACEQSGRVALPEIELPVSLQQAVARTQTADTVLLVLDPWARSIPLQKYTPPTNSAIAVCIGPEGGFTEDELEFLCESGAVSVTCGPRVLRSETAGIVAVAACQMLWGDW